MNYLVDVLVWIMAVFGTTTIVVNSTIMAPVRNLISKVVPPLGNLVNCFLCTGFWAGVFWSTFHWDPFQQFDTNPILSAIFAGCIGSGAGWIMYLNIFPLMQGK